MRLTDAGGNLESWPNRVALLGAAARREVAASRALRHPAFALETSTDCPPSTDSEATDSLPDLIHAWFDARSAEDEERSNEGRTKDEQSAGVVRG
ncbi:MAG: hypothetical protein U1G07_14380 [Verrucomicrobiota bacterium]